MGGWVQDVGVRHVPGARGGGAIIAHGSLWGTELGPMGVESVAVFVLWGAQWVWGCLRVDLEDGVGWSIDVGIDAQAEQVLVIVGVDARRDFGAPAMEVLARVHGISVKNAGEFDVKLDGAVLVKDPVDGVFVIGGGKDVGDDQFAATGGDDGVVPEVSVFEEDTSVLFVDADGVLDCLRVPSAIDEIGILDKYSVHIQGRTVVALQLYHVMNASFAVTS